jgi:hypothetical protein
MENMMALEKNREILLSSTTYRLLESLSQELSQKGMPVRPYSTQSIFAYANLDESRKTTINQTLMGAIALLPAANIPEPTPERPVHPEKETVLQALEHFGVELRDDLWAHLQPDEIIEIYDANDIQIFRTFNFFKVSSYSLLDLLTNEWFHLWERPKGILEIMMSRAKDVHTNIDGVENCKIPRHVLKEIFDDKENSFSSRKSVMIEFNVLCPLYRVGLPIRSGYVITSRAEILDQGKETDKLHFV